ncbi:MAG TPA: indolepyruvate oxidoreductase subunit beta [Firmicutes bacterium]|nr:indolepyruvate oxidoreductase subunit beta [Bacillota bacterium]
MKPEQAVLNILLAGVGGQGIILAGKLLARVGITLGLDVKMSEIHGMAQRGGSVVTEIRMGPQVNSPLVERGQADFIMALEQLEAWRLIPYLKKGGTVVVSTQVLKPLPVITGKQEYPAGLAAKLSRAAGKAIILDAYGLAVAAGEPRAANVVLLGALLREMGVGEEEGLAALEAVVPARYLEKNKTAFLKGYNAVGIDYNTAG